MSYDDMTNQEWLSQLSRQPALLDAARAVVEAATENAEAVTVWRGYFSGPHPPTRREQKARMDRVTETRTALDEAVDAYKNARCMARCQPALTKLENEASLMLAK